MTLKNILSATLCMALGLCALVSCSSDDKDEPATPAARSIAGTYTGDMECTVMNSTDKMENMTYTLTASSDETVDISIPSFGNPPMQLPEITVKNVKVSGEKGAYTIHNTETSGTLDNGKTYKVTIAGSATDSDVKIQFNLQYGNMPMPMICSFEGAKK